MIPPLHLYFFCNISYENTTPPSSALPIKLNLNWYGRLEWDRKMQRCHLEFPLDKSWLNHWNLPFILPDFSAFRCSRKMENFKFRIHCRKINLFIFLFCYSMCYFTSHPGILHNGDINSNFKISLCFVKLEVCSAFDVAHKKI